MTTNYSHNETCGRCHNEACVCPKPLDRDKLPPVPEGTSVDVADPDSNTWGLWCERTDTYFMPRHLPQLRKIVAWLEQANGLAPQVEGERHECKHIARILKGDPLQMRCQDCGIVIPKDQLLFGTAREGYGKQKCPKCGRLRSEHIAWDIEACSTLLESLPAASSAEASGIAPNDGESGNARWQRLVAKAKPDSSAEGQGAQGDDCRMSPLCAVGAPVKYDDKCPSCKYHRTQVAHSKSEHKADNLNRTGGESDTEATNQKPST